MQVEIYSDVVCPWCYIGERRFRRALERYAGRDGVVAIFRPYQLDPGAPAGAVPLREYLAGRFGAAAEAMMARVGDVARGEGIEIDWERAQAANTFTAHRLLQLALAEYGPETQLDLADALFAAHFCEGGDVSDHGLLTDLAAAAGMDRARVAAYLASGEGEEATRQAIERAVRTGVRAVPTFVFQGRWMVQGARSVETFLTALERVGAELAREGSAAGAPGDAWP